MYQKAKQIIVEERWVGTYRDSSKYIFWYEGILLGTIGCKTEFWVGGEYFGAFDWIESFTPFPKRSIRELQRTLGTEPRLGESSVIDMSSRTQP